MAHPVRPELLGHIVERLKAVADENRLRLLMRLREGNCHVTALSEELGISQASTSKHLSVLRQAGLIDVTRQGTQAIYRIDDPSVFEMCQIVCDGVVRHIQRQQDILKNEGEGI